MSDTERRSVVPEQDDTSFLDRWSRRKLQARDGRTERPDDAAPEAPAPVADATTAEAVPAPRELTDEDMPALESLHQDADVSMFFSAKVSPQLRRQALRRLFHTPKFNIRDGLDDFDEDYTYFAPLGDTVTADMRYMKDVAERRARELAEREARERRSVAAAASDESPAPDHAPDADRPRVDDALGTRADADTHAHSESATGDEERSA